MKLLDLLCQISRQIEPQFKQFWYPCAMATKISVIPGDGIGPEIMKSTIEVLQKSGAPLEFDEIHAGKRALQDLGALLPDPTLQTIKENKVAIKGPITTPVGEGFKSLNVSLRKIFHLYANVRPVRNLPNVPCRYPDVDLVIVRENTEDLYTGEEKQIDADTAESTKRITRQASERIADFAFQLAQKRKRQIVTAAHKANIMKLSDGLFLKSCQDIAEKYPTIEFKDVIIDACCMQLVRWPESFDVIVTENLYGDILSDLCAGLVGGLGVVPGANIGKEFAIFEAVHGSAPDIAGQNLANPTALIQSAIMMLEHLDMQDHAEKIFNALVEALKSETARTKDVGGSGSTTDFTNAILSNL